MMMTTSRLRQIGWGVVLFVCILGFAVLSLTVHAVRSEVLVSDTRIVELERKRQRLETEFLTRASQHRLARWNRVDMGYIAPRADQYIDGHKQLAALGQPTGPGAPSPIRVARADDAAGPMRSARAMVSPVSGRPVTLAALDAEPAATGAFVELFGDLLVEASPIREAKAQTGPQLPAGVGAAAAGAAAGAAE